MLDWGMSFSDYLENKLLDHAFRNVAYTPPAAVYVALYTAAPSDSGGGTEVSGNGYARVEATFGAASGGEISNSSAVTFDPATGSWGEITHFGIFDAASSGNLLDHGALTTPKTIDAEDTADFAVGILTVTLD
jgi:hypothetical protein